LEKIVASLHHGLVWRLIHLQVLAMVSLRRLTITYVILTIRETNSRVGGSVYISFTQSCKSSRQNGRLQSMLHDHAAWIWARTCRMIMGSQHGHKCAAWTETCSIDMGMQHVVVRGRNTQTLCGSIMTYTIVMLIC
jgi:hypothetical protein